MYCRTCCSEIEDGNSINLTDNTVSISIIVRKQLELCVPEVVVETVYDPVMCRFCVNALNSAFEFKYRCLQIEEQLCEYTRLHEKEYVDIIEMLNGSFSSNGLEDVNETSFDSLTSTCPLMQTSDIKIEYEEPADAESIDIKINEVFLETKWEDCKPDLPSPCSNPVELSTLNKLCKYEEDNLKFNSILMEQEEFCCGNNTINVPKDVSNLVNSLACYSFDSWNKFEERCHREPHEFMLLLTTKREQQCRSIKKTGNQQQLTQKIGKRRTTKQTNKTRRRLKNETYKRHQKLRITTTIVKVVSQKFEITTPCYSLWSVLQVTTWYMKSWYDHQIIRCVDVNDVTSVERLLKPCSIVLSPLCSSYMESLKNNSIVIYKKKTPLNSKQKLGTTDSVRKSESLCKTMSNLYQCDQCEYTTTLEIDLELHVITHIAVYKFNQFDFPYYDSDSGSMKDFSNKEDTYFQCQFLNPFDDDFLKTNTASLNNLESVKTTGTLVGADLKDIHKNQGTEISEKTVNMLTKNKEEDNIEQDEKRTSDNNECLEKIKENWAKLTTNFNEILGKDVNEVL